MGIIGWILKQSPAFRSLLKDFHKHKENTRSSFQRVKRDNLAMAKKLIEHERKIAKLQGLIKSSEPIKIYIKKKTKS